MNSEMAYFFGFINKLNLQIIYNLTICKFCYYFKSGRPSLRVGCIKVPPKYLISSTHKSIEEIYLFVTSTRKGYVYTNVGRVALIF